MENVKKSKPVTRLNPQVSWTKYTNGKYTSNGSRLDIIDLYSLMKQCESGSWKDLLKGDKCILPYKSNYMGVKPYKFDGVVFVDLDKFTTIPELKGKQHEIFNRFHELTDILDHLLSIKYSPSGNLHAFFYHTSIKDEKEYDELAGLDMALLAYAIKKLIGLDLRDFDGALDAHQKHYQKLNVNDSKV